MTYVVMMTLMRDGNSDDVCGNKIEVKVMYTVLLTIKQANKQTEKNNLCLI